MKTIACLVLIVLGPIMAKVHAQDYESIMVSVDSGNLEEFKALIDTIDNVNFMFSNGYPLLHYAVLSERPDFVEYLLNNGAEVDIKDRYGRNALLIAMITSNHEAINILKSHGASLSLKGGADGPYIFDYNSDTSIVVSVNQENQLTVDTINNHLQEIYIRTPVTDSIIFRLEPSLYGEESVFENPGKIFVVSDIEGNFIDFINILINNNIVDKRLNWSFGDGHLVLLGDFVDRGIYVTQVLWLIYKLEQEAMAYGGRVHYLLGNHELMNFDGDVRYVNEKYHALAFTLGKDTKELLGNNSFLGKWLRTKNVIEKIGNFLFVHGGISDSLLQAKLSIPQINEIIRFNIDKPREMRDPVANLIADDFGVLWFRGFITGYLSYDKTNVKVLDEILAFYNVNKIIVGHTIVKDISTDYGGRIIRVDVDHYSNTSSGILIDGKKIFKVTKNGKKQRIR